ncbi:MAG: hypothetical protein Q4C51_07345 [Clostridia bacterium]|nr:hypothetical protein [Clostridia bacterium]
MNLKNSEYIKAKTEEAKDNIVNAGRKVSDSEALDIVEDITLDNRNFFNLSDYNDIIEAVYAKTRNKLGLLENYINDDDYNEIMVNGVDNIFAEHRV